jgi:hypothetical protein
MIDPPKRGSQQFFTGDPPLCRSSWVAMMTSNQPQPTELAPQRPDFEPPPATERPAYEAEPHGRPSWDPEQGDFS